MRSIIVGLFLILLINSAQTFAYTPRSGNISIVLGPTSSRTIFNDTEDVKSPADHGAGLLIMGDANGRGNLEIGVFFMPKLFIREVDGNYISQKSQYVNITMGYRYWATDYLSAALSFYSAYTMGTPSMEFNNLRPDQPETTSAEDTTEYGFDLSLMTEVWTSGRWGVIVEGRYSQSVTPKTGESANAYGGMVGVRWLIQEKGKGNGGSTPSSPIEQKESDNKPKTDVVPESKDPQSEEIVP